MSRKLKRHIKYLIQSEEKPGSSLMWTRLSDNTISISCVGYITQELMTIENDLTRLGLRIDFTEGRGFQKWDKISCRTFSYFKESK
jgi:hypothetical protein